MDLQVNTFFNEKGIFYVFIAIFMITNNIAEIVKVFLWLKYEIVLSSILLIYIII